MDYDRWLQLPYEQQEKEMAQIEKVADELFHDPEASFYEFLNWFIEKPNDKEIIDAVRQQDFEALGGLIYARYEDFIWDAAEESVQNEL